MAGAQAGDDLVDIVDEAGETVAVATRAAMRAESLRHRAVYVVVRSSAGEVLVHRRAPWKDIYPSRWDVAAGGVLHASEAWESAAERELAEELGVRGALQPLGEGAFEDDEVRVVGRVYQVAHDGPFAFDDGEVAEVRFVALGELPAFLAERATCPDGVAIVLPLLPP